MKTSTKIGLGLSIAAVAGISATMMASDKLLKKMSHASNRCKAKRMVEDKFNGNEKLMDIVEDLSDDELEKVMQVLGKVKEGRQKISDYGEVVKDNSSQVKDRLFRFIEELM